MWNQTKWWPGHIAEHSSPHTVPCCGMLCLPARAGKPLATCGTWWQWQSMWVLAEKPMLQRVGLLWETPGTQCVQEHWHRLCALHCRATEVSRNAGTILWESLVLSGDVTRFPKQFFALSFHKVYWFTVKHWFTVFWHYLFRMTQIVCLYMANQNRGWFWGHAGVFLQLCEPSQHIQELLQLVFSSVL